MSNAVGKPQFSLFDSLKYYQIWWKHSFWIGFSDILSKLTTAIYPLCFKKQILLELLLHLFFGAKLPTNGI